MKLIHKLILALVALAALGFATPAQAHHHHHDRDYDGGYDRHYGDYGGPRVYYAQPYYDTYYGPDYYRPGVTVVGGGPVYYHRHHHFLFW